MGHQMTMQPDDHYELGGVSQTGTAVVRHTMEMVLLRLGQKGSRRHKEAPSASDSCVIYLSCSVHT